MRLTNLIASLCALGLASSTFAQQGPDVLIPTGSNDGAFALVDKDKDGKYTTVGEAWDWLLSAQNTSPRYFILHNKRIYFPDPALDAIVSVADTNQNGRIESTEQSVFWDAAKNLGASNPVMITMDAQGWMWSCVNSGSAPGIYRHKDLNDDGDAEDVGETIAVLTEKMAKVPVYNTPATTGSPPVPPLQAMTGVDFIQYDPTWGKGRFLIEDEAVDQTIALEDKNQDGDFNDAGEVYLFCALDNAGSLVKDVNPDVSTNKLPSANEIRGIIIDTTTKTYYLMSSETTATDPDAAIVFRGLDKNNDGDINDAGEVTVFWDGSLDSSGAVKAYNFIVGMEIDASGRLLVCAELDGDPDSEELILVEDKNKDGDANDAGETTVLWHLGSDGTHYRPALLPPGTLSTLTGVTTLAQANYYGLASCRSSLPGNHNIQYGSAQNGGASKPPVVGNTRWTIRTWGAASSALAAYGIGLRKFATGTPMDVKQTCRIYGSLDVITLYFTTNVNGEFDLRLGIPNRSSLLGLWTYWQSIVVDPNAPSGLGITLSNGLELRIGDWSMTK